MPIAPQRTRRRLPCNVYDALFCIPSLADYHRGTPQRSILEHPRFVATAGGSHRRCSVEPCQQNGMANGLSFSPHAGAVNKAERCSLDGRFIEAPFLSRSERQFNARE
ncbi:MULTISPECIES: hypothetical protein [Burkholderiaceae]|uniref:hypothetical protein n=1 Tax=Burkholderiaceae TaxID=119060 RepID=UPI00147E66BC|nr:MULTISPECIES: hypothetical protein [Burkholderiaceae]MCG1040800.1 hypothetical protein [Mycetohabitans sp. B7]